MMYWDLYLCMGFGVLAVIFSFLITISQLYSSFKYKNTSGLAMPTYIIFMVACFICFLWSVSYYLKVMYSWPTESVDPSIIHPGKQQPYGPYWLLQCTILPITGYYLFDFLMGIVFLIIKIRHVILSKKLNMNEMALSSYLLKQQKDKEIKSGFKLWRRKYFGFVIIVIFLTLFVVVFTVLFGFLVRPEYDPDFNPKEVRWILVWVLNLVGAATFEAISWPQFIKCIREKNTSAISLNWAIFLPLSMLISFLYALSLTLTHANIEFPPDTIGGLIFNGLIVNFGVLIIKLINIHRAHKLHMTELEYARKYLIPKYEKKKMLRNKYRKNKK